MKRNKVFLLLGLFLCFCRTASIYVGGGLDQRQTNGQQQGQPAYQQIPTQATPSGAIPKPPTPIYAPPTYRIADKQNEK